MDYPVDKIRAAMDVADDISSPLIEGNRLRNHDYRRTLSNGPRHARRANAALAESHAVEFFDPPAPDNGGGDE